MRQSSDRRDTLSPWGDAREVISLVDGERGTVISVDAAGGTITVQWRDGPFPVVYPDDTRELRKVFPWER